MEEITEALCTVVWNTALNYMRMTFPHGWTPEEYWEFVRSEAFGVSTLPLKKGRTLQVLQLNEALLDLDVPREDIRKEGEHWRLKLDHIDYVYRNQRFKDGRTELQIAPHPKGLKFSKCSHSFVRAGGSALDWAQRLIDLDRAIPQMKTTCEKAYREGLQEIRIREIKLATARAFLKDCFGGELPRSVVACRIDDSAPGASDLILVDVHDDGAPFWKTRSFTIPYDRRASFDVSVLRDFIKDPTIPFARLEFVRDDGSGRDVPVIRTTPSTDDFEIDIQ